MNDQTLRIHSSHDLRSRVPLIVWLMFFVGGCTSRASVMQNQRQWESGESVRVIRFNPCQCLTTRERQLRYAVEMSRSIHLTSQQRDQLVYLEPTLSATRSSKLDLAHMPWTLERWERIALPQLSDSTTAILMRAWKQSPHNLFLVKLDVTRQVETITQKHRIRRVRSLRILDLTGGAKEDTGP